MRDWASSGRIKIDRADEHIRNLKTEIGAFRDRRPYHVVGEPNAHGYLGGTPFVIRSREPIPPHWSAATADAVHNLNVALDYLWQRAIHGTRVVHRDHFPVFPDPESAKARFKGKEKGRVKTAVDILYSVKAFKIGNPFWAIRCFDDTDKHDTMNLVARSLQSISVDFGPKVPLRTRLFPISNFEIIEDGVILFVRPSLSSHPTLETEHDIAFEITFGDSEILKGEAVVPTLKYFSTAVDSLAAAFIANRLIT